MFPLLKIGFEIEVNSLTQLVDINNVKIEHYCYAPELLCISF